jgi:hyaluronan synthase
MGRLGCVLVNSGNFSLYRTRMIKEAIPAYENETFAGRPVQFSDDSMLTLFAHLNGRTVQQPSSFAFTGNSWPHFGQRMKCWSRRGP